MTLKELIEKHGFGVWLATQSEPNEKWFKPLARGTVLENKIIGESVEGFAVGHLDHIGVFVLYEPLKQKKKVKLYKYFYKSKRSVGALYIEHHWISMGKKEFEDTYVAQVLSTEEKEVEVSE